MKYRPLLRLKFPGVQVPGLRPLWDWQAFYPIALQRVSASLDRRTNQHAKSLRRHGEGGSAPCGALMDSLLEHLDRFSEVLAVSLHNPCQHLGPRNRSQGFTVGGATCATSTGALAAMRVFAKLWSSDCKTSGSRRVTLGPTPAPGLANSVALGHCDQLLSLRLLANPALGDAFTSCYSSSFGPGVPDAEEECPGQPGPLRPLPGRCPHAALPRLQGEPGPSEGLSDEDAGGAASEASAGGGGSRSWGFWQASQPPVGAPAPEQLPKVAAALLLPAASPRLQEEELGVGSPRTPETGVKSCFGLASGEIRYRGCLLPQPPSRAFNFGGGRHPELSPCLSGSAHKLCSTALWPSERPFGLELSPRMCPGRSCSAGFKASVRPLLLWKDEVLTALKSYKAQDGDFWSPWS